MRKLLHRWCGCGDKIDIPGKLCEICKWLKEDGVQVKTMKERRLQKRCAGCHRVLYRKKHLWNDLKKIYCWKCLFETWEREKL